MVIRQAEGFSPSQKQKKARPPRQFMPPSSPIALLASCRTTRQALQVHAQVLLRGLHRCQLSLSKLISFFALSGTPFGLHHSGLLFSRLDKPDVFVCNTMIRGYSRGEAPSDALIVFKSMAAEGGTSANHFTFPFLVNSCTKVPRPEMGREVHCYIIKSGFISDTFVANSLMHFYSHFGDIEGARQLFDEGPHRDAVSYNTVINAYVRGGQAVDVLSFFEGMCKSDVLPDEYSFVSLLSICSFLGDPRAGKLIHQLIYKRLDVDRSGVVLKNALVNMYAKCGQMEMAEQVFNMIPTCDKANPAVNCMISGYAGRGEIGVARKFFDELPVKDLIAWTCMIGGYSQLGRYREALDLFQEMENVGVKADEVTTVIALSACAQLGAIEMGKRLHQYAETMSFTYNPILIAAIVDMYAKCGFIGTAVDLFRGVDDNSKTVSLFNSMIFGLAQHGLGKMALTIFREMGPLDLKPDEITFTVVLCACSHGGLIEEGKEIFDSMLTKHGIKPQIEHYGCMVDLLGRNGLLREAYDFIKGMPTEANSVIWLSLLAACRKHGNIEIGEVVARQLLFDPNDGGSCVLLSRILADAKRWEDAGNIRNLIDRKHIKKPPAWSYIEWNGSMNQFQANDESHPQAREISMKLEEMNCLLKSAGYIPRTEQVPFDIHEEEKESAVSYHSEKLALAFGLLNMDPMATVRIFKNLRICNDCHASFKILSKAYSREIIVRDRIRFHHMKDGLCSCEDYW